MHLVLADSSCEFSTSEDYKHLITNLYEALNEGTEYTPERFIKHVDCKPQLESFDDIRVLDSFFGLSCRLKTKPDNLAGAIMIVSPAVACAGSKTIYENYIEAMYFWYCDQEAAWERLEYIFEVLNAKLYHNKNLRGARLHKGKVYSSATLVIDVSNNIRILRDLLSAKRVIVAGVESQMLSTYAAFLRSHDEMDVDIEVLSEDDKTLIVNIVA